MAKLGEKYEAVVVFSLVGGDDNVKGLVEKFSNLIKGQAELVGVEEWGKRRLAYPINYENDGYYVLYSFDCKPDFPREFERVINITDGVLRSLVTVRVQPAQVAG
ncbi:MAG: 30S ribosomal protein S6 [Oscillospiraceae bacterium]|nr:30S ribosomal protein S6 [Oscillospiraceae bacterium]